MADFNLDLTVTELENIIELTIDNDPTDISNTIELDFGENATDPTNVIELDFGDADVGGMVSIVLDYIETIDETKQEIESIAHEILDKTLQYGYLQGKPQINSVELVGDKKSTELSLVDAEDSITASEIDAIIFGGLGANG